MVLSFSETGDEREGPRRRGAPAGAGSSGLTQRTFPRRLQHLGGLLGHHGDGSGRGLVPDLSVGGAVRARKQAVFLRRREPSVTTRSHARGTSGRGRATARGAPGRDRVQGARLWKERPLPPTLHRSPNAACAALGRQRGERPAPQAEANVPLPSPPPARGRPAPL